MDMDQEEVNADRSAFVGTAEYTNDWKKNQAALIRTSRSEK
jgi:hypothetical protein